MEDTLASDRIRAYVLDRGLKPGDRLPAERVLAEKLGVSRPIVRAGIQRLHDLGVVRTRPGSGTYYTPVDLVNLLDVRLRLEPWIAGLAAGHCADEDAATLRDLASRAPRLLDDAERFAAHDAEFHRSVVAASGNDVAGALLDGLGVMLAASRARTSRFPGLRRAAAADLHEIARAISGGDVPGAERAMRAHIERLRPEFEAEGA